MSKLSITEYDLLEFFRAEPVSREYGEKWFDVDSCYEFRQDNGLVLTCSIHPIHRDARITLSLQEEILLDWQATTLDDIRYIEEKGTSYLRFMENKNSWLILRLLPRISLTSSVGKLEEE